MYHQLHDPAFLAVASGGTPALDLFFSATKTLDSRITFSRGSSGTFINENGNVVGKTPGTTSSITPSTTSIGSQVTVTVASGSVVGWAVGQAISLIVDTDGQDDPDAGELWLLGDIVSSTLTTLTFTVTSRTATAGSATSWTLGYRGARFTHDPVTLASLGLLVEESRTNLLVRSEEFDNASWSQSNITVSANATSSPDGILNADKVVENTTTSIHRISTSISRTSGTTYTLSVYAKAAGRTLLFVNAGAIIGAQSTFNLANGTVSATASGTASIVSLAGGWYRCSVTGTATATGLSQFFFQVNNTVTAAADDSYLGDGTSGILLWGAQLEAGAFATSYIPTTSATATRAADVATMTGTNFSSWYRQDEGTLVVEYIPIGVGPSPYVFASQVDDGSLANRHLLVHSSDGTTGANRPRAFSAVGGAPQADIYSAQQQAIGAFGKLGLAYQLNNYAAAFSGVMLGTDSLATVPSVNVLRIGRDHSSGSFSTIARIRYYRRRLPNANLQTLTT